MADETSISRRSLLAVGAGGAGVLVGGGLLAACSSSGAPSKQADADGDHDGDKSTDTDGNDDTGAPSGSPTATAGEAIATVADIGVGKAVSAKLPDGKPALVSRPSANEIVCFSAICTHQGCTVAPGPSSLDCPCHGSKYDTATGKVIGGPAPSPLPRIAVTVEDGKVVTS